MISTKYALFMVAAFVTGASIFASPVPQAIAAVIATDVQCTGCVGAADLASSAVTTTKLASNSVNGGKVTDQSLSAADLGPDSVGASEIKGVTKLIFAKCTITDNISYAPLGGQAAHCLVPGTTYVDTDSAIVTNNGNPCYVTMGIPTDGSVYVRYTNICSSSNPFGTNQLAIIVFAK